MVSWRSPTQGALLGSRAPSSYRLGYGGSAARLFRGAGGSSHGAARAFAGPPARRSGDIPRILALALPVQAALSILTAGPVQAAPLPGRAASRGCKGGSRPENRDAGLEDLQANMVAQTTKGPIKCRVRTWVTICNDWVSADARKVGASMRQAGYSSVRAWQAPASQERRPRWNTARHCPGAGPRGNGGRLPRHHAPPHS